MDGENSKGKYERVQVTHCNDVYNTGVVHSHHQMSYLFTVVTLNCTEASCLSNKVCRNFSALFRRMYYCSEYL